MFHFMSLDLRDLEILETLSLSTSGWNEKEQHVAGTVFRSAHMAPENLVDLDHNA